MYKTTAKNKLKLIIYRGGNWKEGVKTFIFHYKLTSAIFKIKHTLFLAKAK